MYTLVGKIQNFILSFHSAIMKINEPGTSQTCNGHCNNNNNNKAVNIVIKHDLYFDLRATATNFCFLYQVFTNLYKNTESCKFAKAYAEL